MAPQFDSLNYVLWQMGSGHTSLYLYLSVSGTEDPDAKAQPIAMVLCSPAASLWSPRDGESELSRAGGAGSLDLLRPSWVIHFLTPQADYLVITLFCQRLSDEIGLCESQGQRDMAERGCERKTAQRLLTDHVLSIKNSEKLLSFCFWRHRRKEKPWVFFLLWFPSSVSDLYSRKQTANANAIFPLWRSPLPQWWDIKCAPSLLAGDYFPGCISYMEIALVLLRRVTYKSLAIE